MLESNFEENIINNNVKSAEPWNEDLPTIIELNDHDNFHSLIQPALNHAIKVLGSEYIKRLKWIGKSSEEISVLLHLTLESIFMRTNGTSFCEFVYDFKRNKMASSLPWNFNIPVVSSLLYSVFLPYFRIKLESKYLREQSEVEQVSEKPSPSYFISLYPHLITTYAVLNLISQVAYTLKGFKYYNPVLYVMGMVVSRKSEDGAVGQEVKSLQTNKLMQRINFRSLVVKSGLVVVGCFQFLDWWQREDKPAINLFPTHVPSYPPTDEVTNELILILCPLCRRHRSHDTVLATSGYVFCNTCISDYVRAHSRCPVTGYPTNQDTLVSLYVDQ